jgi:CubicO group peptidase (beta-lactamase class C family)
MNIKKSNLRSCWVFVFLFLWPLETSAQSKSMLIDEYIAGYHHKGLFHGAVLVSKGSDIILKKGYGLANREWDIPFEPDTRMDIGSLTKSFTSLLVMQRVERGEIQLDATVNDYLPEYRKDIGQRVTIHHLLSNTSGIPDIMDYPEMRSKLIKQSYTLNYAVEHFCSEDLKFEPGSKFEYSSSGFLILGAILERITGKSYGSLLEECILKPAGMTNTGVDRDSLILKKRASGYIRKDDDFIREPYMNIDVATSAGGIYSTVEDLFKFNRALNTDKLLSKKYRETMFQPNIDAFGGRGKYAYGWGVFQVPLADSGGMVQAIAHGGSSFGKETLFTQLGDDDYLIVLFCNTEIGQGALMKMMMEITNILY